MEIVIYLRELFIGGIKYSCSVIYAGQNSGRSDGAGISGTKAKNIPKELASTINDGLYYYEQVRFFLQNDMILPLIDLYL